MIVIPFAAKWKGGVWYYPLVGAIRLGQAHALEFAI